ncbi:NVEALA domain-containing protein [Phocaeicola coprophilus]|uniref:NVEALA domain-containing protein n=1 Tax=Phocaeicola coprophilus TaxID=387090 RepID=UPI003A5236C7
MHQLLRDSSDGGYICRESDTDKTSTVLVMKNIEALADNEDTTNHACYGYGDIDCFGIKAKLRIDIFSLD